VHGTSREHPLVTTGCRVPLRVVDLGRRGRGVVAERDIEAGALIERAPVLVAPERDRAALDGTAIGNHIFMWEHGTTGEDVYSQRGRAAVVLGLASLINHAAAPNCDFIRYIEAEILDVFALRPIAAGEELTFDYGMTLWFKPE
jgi:SET domain-containing protein